MPLSNHHIRIMTEPHESKPERETLAGIIAALTAFCAWGFSPLYFKLFEGAVPAPEILSHRVLWTVLMLGVLFQLRGLWPRVRVEIASPRRLLAYLLTTTLIGANWGVFIWAVNNNHIVEASLGYYINPLVVVALAMLFLGERLRPWQWLAVTLALAGVGYKVWQVGSLPVVAICLAFSFSTYAVIRKREQIDPFIGLFVETALLLPVALLYLAWVHIEGSGAWLTQPLGINLLLSLAGLVTAIPLICYMEGAKRLALKTMGLLSYLSPTLQLMVGVMIFHEPFTADTGVTFVLIWFGLAVYTADAYWLRHRNTHRLANKKAGA